MSIRTEQAITAYAEVVGIVVTLTAFVGGLGFLVSWIGEGAP